MKVVCFGLTVMLIAAVAYIWLARNRQGDELWFAAYVCGLLAFLGGGLVLVGLEGM